jgi:hypothetical protein
MSTTVTIELPPREELRSPPGEPDQAYAPNPDANVTRVKQKWNEPSINKWRIAAAFASFAITGASDGVYGVSFHLEPQSTSVELSTWSTDNPRL